MEIKKRLYSMNTPAKEFRRVSNLKKKSPYVLENSIYGLNFDDLFDGE